LNAEPLSGPARRHRGAPPDRLVVRLPRALREAMIGHCRAALPNEGCGLLIGQRDAQVATVIELRPTPNERASADRYEIAPESVLAADRDARAMGALVLGAFHAHPLAAAVPSLTDRAEAWPDWCYLILGLRQPGAPELRAWRLLGEDFVEDTLEHP
jgi:proteasome lid subunit RPN8/RPN11